MKTALFRLVVANAHMIEPDFCASPSDQFSLLGRGSIWLIQERFYDVLDVQMR